jgi:eukaryotic-like serine/threonine-protein kinase
MDAARWQLLQDSFHAALALPDTTAQRAFLEQRHADDPTLAAEVMAMLEADARSHSLLDRDLAQVADSMLRAPLATGSTFGPYRIKGLLGEGGMGVVCLAEREDVGSVVAIKVLRDAWLSPARRERFAVEQRVLAQLEHPGIARLYDAGTLADGTPWFAMEYVEGITLTDYCSTHQCGAARRLQLFRQACEAVRFAHAHAVIHRDIKPSNILVKQDGSVHLLDFGIAKQLDGLQGSDGTRTMFRLMTPAYAAPEQLFGNQVGVHTDVYSLGVVLYELLTGRLPFDLRNLSASETTAVVARHAAARPSQVASLAGQPGAPSRAEWADLDVLCLKAMHPEPARRYSSVEALVRDIDHYLHSEPLDARPDSWSYRTGKFLRRHWQIVGVASAAAVLTIALSSVFTLRLAKARDVARNEAARTERVQRMMTSLFQGGDSLAGPGNELKVIEVLDRGTREAQALTSDPAVQAELLYQLASIYQKLRQAERADALFAESLRLRIQLYGAGSDQVAECLVATGLLRLDQARLEDAETLVRRGRDLALRTLPPDHPQVIAASLALGRTLRERGAHEEAIAILTQAVALQSGPQVAPADAAAALSELADAHYSAGHYEAAEPLYQQLIALHRRQLGETHPMIASDLGSLAAIQQDLGYYAAAEQLSRQALQIIEKYYGADSPHAADHLTSLGRALTFEKKLDEATQVLERAERAQAIAYGDSHPVIAETANEIGNVLASQGRYAQAEQKYRGAAAIYRSVYGERHYLVGIALSNVAYMQMQQREFAPAEALFRQVIPLFTETLSADNVNTGIARIKLGRTLLRAGRPRDATVETLAGYDILAKQTNPATSYLRAARDDLIAAYEALGEPARAEPYRQGQLAASKPQPATAGAAAR